MLTNCETEIAFVSTADVNTMAIIIEGNEIVHTGAVRHALRLEGAATQLITKLVVASNTIVGGFCTTRRVQYAAINGNVITSGAYASADAVWRIFGTVMQVAFVANLIDRDPAAAVGPCLALEKSTNAPTYVRVGQNLLVQEVTGANFITCVDVSSCSFGANLCHLTDATGTVYGFDFQAVTATITNLLIGPGNQMTASAGSIDAGVRLLANGGNVTDVSVVGNQINNNDYGAQWEVGGGGGAFDGQLLYAGNNHNGTLGDQNNVGVTVRPRIGLNAATLGAQMFSGSGSPEGVITARISSLYLRTDGGQASTVYYKESGTANTGWVAIGGSLIVFGTGDTTAGAGAVFLAPGWIATAIATEVQLAATRPGTIRNLRVQVTTAGTGAATNTYTVRKNGVDTTLTTSISNTSTGPATDLVNSFTVVAGDLLLPRCHQERRRRDRSGERGRGGRACLIRSRLSASCWAWPRGRRRRPTRMQVRELQRQSVHFGSRQTSRPRYCRSSLPTITAGDRSRWASST